MTLEKSALLNLLTHNVKKIIPIKIIKKVLIRGIITNPFTLKAMPDLTRSSAGTFSICNVIYLKADVVYVNGFRYITGARIFGIAIVGIYAPDKKVRGNEIMVISS